eukprot:UC1_evm1s474
MWEWKAEISHGEKHWCALYSAASQPIPNPAYDVGCRMTCPGKPPSPSPSPPPPGPPAPPTPPPPAPPARGVMDAYWYGWSMYWLLSLNSNAKGTYETVRHAQSAPNNFLGLHLHDTQFYLQTGAWVRPDAHPDWAHGNIIMWDRARRSPMLTGSDGRNNLYWNATLAKGVLPDNVGGTWVASSTCDQLVFLIPGTWGIYLKGGNTTFLEQAYALFFDTLAPESGNLTDVHAHRTNWEGGGEKMVALETLVRMAAALNRTDDVQGWNFVYNYNAPSYMKQWNICGSKWGCNNGITSFKSLLAMPPLTTDEQAGEAAELWLLNSDYGYYPPNRTFGAPPL